jgi:hypothetical protein
VRRARRKNWGEWRRKQRRTKEEKDQKERGNGGMGGARAGRRGSGFFPRKSQAGIPRIPAQGGKRKEVGSGRFKWKVGARPWEQEMGKKA